jgi:hypothetical protein
MFQIIKNIRRNKAYNKYSFGACFSLNQQILSAGINLKSNINQLKQRKKAEQQKKKKNLSIVFRYYVIILGMSQPDNIRQAMV